MPKKKRWGKKAEYNTYTHTPVSPIQLFILQNVLVSADVNKSELTFTSGLRV